MERIALISDIHSNIVALKAVLKDIEERNITRIFCLGDIVLKGSSPCEVLDIIREKCEVVIKGNCDDYSVNADNFHKQWYKDKLGEERISYLSNLPMYKDISMSGSNIRLFHASKNDLNYRILDISSEQEKLHLFDDENGNIPDIVIYADIHKQYLEKIQNKTILNIGSVGNPLEISLGDIPTSNMEELTQAHYCIIEGYLNAQEKKPLGIQFIRVPYNIEEELKLAQQNGSPDYEKYELELLKGKYRGKHKQE